MEQIQTTFSPTVDRDGLGQLIFKKSDTISMDRVRRPQTLPPACIPPGSQKPIWIVEDVINWLRQFQEKPQSTKPKLGASTKVERVRRKRENVDNNQPAN